MRILLAIGFALACANAAATDSIPLNAVNRASEVIDRAIDAHGGAAALQNITSAYQASKFTNYATNQSRRPGPPWDTSVSSNVYAVDFEGRRAFTSFKGEGSGFITDNATLIGTDESYNVDRRRGTITPLTDPSFDTTIGPFVRVTPPLLIRSLMLRRHTSHWLGEAEVNGAPADIVTLVMETGPALSLYIDRKSGLLVKAERVLPPFGQVEYRYLDYASNNGIAVNQGFELFSNGEPNLVIDLGPLVLNKPVDNYLRVPEKLERTEAAAPDTLQARELGKGVHLIGGSGTYALFVEANDSVIAIGGTAGIPERIAELRKTGNNKPIRFGVMTHHHGDHILGVAPYVEEGATIIGHASHAEVFRGAAEGDIQLQTVEDRHRIGRGKNRVVLYDIGPTPHSEHILVAYLPGHKLLFQADHSGVPSTGTVGPAQPAAIALNDAIDRLGLDVDGIISAHSARVLSKADLEDAVRLARSVAGG